MSSVKSRLPIGESLIVLAALLTVLIGFDGGAAYAESPDGSILGDVPQRELRVVHSSPLVVGKLNLGRMVLYDDPSTSRAADYLELYDARGGLAVVSWFDRFGIQRIAVDRAFVDGEEKLEGIFVAVVDDSFI